MGYVRVTGGQEAIMASESVVDYFRLHNAQFPLAVSEIRTQMRLLIDRIMGEAGFYAPDYAALAIKQCEGDALEAAFMLRAYRSTLERRHRAVSIDIQNMHIIRRISSAFRNVPGGQVLGPTYDYTHRWLRFALCSETPENIREALAKAKKLTESHSPLNACARVPDSLRKEGLLPALPEGRSDEEPYDITREKLLFPAPRSARLQTLARGETGVLTALAYSSMRGYGAVHPTIGELRVGFVELWIEYPYGEDLLCVGELMVTEVESVNPFKDDHSTALTMGYGLCFGQNEVKAIAMSILDRSLDTTGEAPAQNEEFVLSHIDTVESMGFVAHLKLPHYVTFQSSLDRMRHAHHSRQRSQEENECGNEIPVENPSL